MDNRTNKALSLLEVTLVILVVVTLSTMAFKKFLFVIERARAVAAVNVLRSLKDAQLQNKELYGSYIGDGDVKDFSVMTTYSKDLEHFNRIEVTTDPKNLARTYRSNGTYHLNISDLGVVYCVVDAGNYDLCDKLGYKEVPLFGITEVKKETQDSK